MFTYGFYNSVNGDRKYDATQMGAIFDGIINDGIFRTVGSAFKVEIMSGMTIKVGTGRAWFNRTWSWNDADFLLDAQPGNISFPRIDTVILEIDEANRTNSIKILTGTPAVSPEPPTLVNSETLHQYPLADTLVNIGAVSLSNITNRVGTSDTPYMTSQFEEDISDWLEDMTNIVEKLDIVRHIEIFDTPGTHSFDAKEDAVYNIIVTGAGIQLPALNTDCFSAPTGRGRYLLKKGTKVPVIVPNFATQEVTQYGGAAAFGEFIAADGGTTVMTSIPTVYGADEFDLPFRRSQRSGNINASYWGISSAWFTAPGFEPNKSLTGIYEGNVIPLAVTDDSFAISGNQTGFTRYSADLSSWQNIALTGTKPSSFTYAYYTNNYYILVYERTIYIYNNKTGAFVKTITMSIQATIGSYKNLSISHSYYTVPGGNHVYLTHNSSGVITAHSAVIGIDASDQEVRGHTSKTFSENFSEDGVFTTYNNKISFASSNDYVSGQTYCSIESGFLIAITYQSWGNTRRDVYSLTNINSYLFSHSRSNGSSSYWNYYWHSTPDRKIGIWYNEYGNDSLNTTKYGGAIYFPTGGSLSSNVMIKDVIPSNSNFKFKNQTTGVELIGTTFRITTAGLGAIVSKGTGGYDLGTPIAYNYYQNNYYQINKIGASSMGIRIIVNLSAQNYSIDGMSALRRVACPYGVNAYYTGNASGDNPAGGGVVQVEWFTNSISDTPVITPDRVIPAVFSSASWNDIIYASHFHLVPDTWKIGDEKVLTLTSGENITLQIYGIMHDEDQTRRKCGLTLGSRHLMAAKRPYWTSTSNGGYYAGQLTTVGSLMYFLNNDLVNILPANIKNAVKFTRKMIHRGSGALTENFIKIFPPSHKEIFGTPGGYDGEGAQYPIFTTAANRIKNLNNGQGVVSDWWTTSRSLTTPNDNIISINTSGTAVLTTNANSTLPGVCFAFCL